MSVWTTKALDRPREYILLKHTIPNVNYQLAGVKFRGGYCVVEKNSKTYHNLLKMPMLKGAKEYPLEFLRKLPFITRTSDIKIIYGRDVYVHYLQADVAAKKQEHLASDVKCKAKTAAGELCKGELIPESPSGYCAIHLMSDPRLQELGVEVPKFMTKSEKKDFREKLLKKLTDLKKDGKF